MKTEVKCRDCDSTTVMETLWEKLDEHEEYLDRWMDGEDITYEHPNGWVELIIHTDLPIICHNFFCPRCKRGDEHG